MNTAFLRTLLGNHVLVNLTFVLVIVVGALAYNLLPRQQDPTINFNWISIITVLPGAAALDVEKKVTDPLEDAIRKVADVRFVTSNSRQSISSILVRFHDLDERTFDKRDGVYEAMTLDRIMRKRRRTDIQHADPPEDAAIVFFSGPRDPGRGGLPWVRRYYK